MTPEEMEEYSILERRLDTLAETEQPGIGREWEMIEARMNEILESEGSR